MAATCIRFPRLDFYHRPAASQTAAGLEGVARQREAAGGRARDARRERVRGGHARGAEKRDLLDGVGRNRTFCPLVLRLRNALGGHARVERRNLLFPAVGIAAPCEAEDTFTELWRAGQNLAIAKCN